MFETHPFLGDPVEGRGLDIFVSITAQGLLGMIIGKDQQNVGLLCFGSVQNDQSYDGENQFKIR